MFLFVLILFGVACAWLGAQWGYRKGTAAFTVDEKIQRFLEGKWKS